ncbi:hypothetical protein GGF32_008189 [Allomyces javanicus]|nr:hypothetical protein GGF32_008189 [Allomyces javanicus]
MTSEDDDAPVQPTLPKNPARQFATPYTTSLLLLIEVCIRNALVTHVWSLHRLIDPPDTSSTREPTFADLQAHVATWPATTTGTGEPLAQELVKAAMAASESASVLRRTVFRVLQLSAPLEFDGAVQAHVLMHGTRIAHESVLGKWMRRYASDVQGVGPAVWGPMCDALREYVCPGEGVGAGVAAAAAGAATRDGARVDGGQENGDVEMADSQAGTGDDGPASNGTDEPTTCTTLPSLARAERFLDHVVVRLQGDQDKPGGEQRGVDMDAIRAVASMSKLAANLPKIYYTQSLIAAHYGDLNRAEKNLLMFTSTARHDLQNNAPGRNTCWSLLAQALHHLRFGWIDAGLSILDQAFTEAKFRSDSECQALISKWQTAAKAAAPGQLLNHFESPPDAWIGTSNIAAYVDATLAAPEDPVQACLVARHMARAESPPAATAYLTSYLATHVCSMSVHNVDRVRTQLRILELEIAVRAGDWACAHVLEWQLHDELGRHARDWFAWRIERLIRQEKWDEVDEAVWAIWPSATDYKALAKSESVAWVVGYRLEVLLSVGAFDAIDAYSAWPLETASTMATRGRRKDRTDSAPASPLAPWISFTSSANNVALDLADRPYLLLYHVLIAAAAAASPATAREPVASGVSKRFVATLYHMTDVGMRARVACRWAEYVERDKEVVAVGLDAANAVQDAFLVAQLQRVGGSVVAM